VVAALDDWTSRNEAECDLALSGGKDCRVVLAALYRAHRRVHPITVVKEGDVRAACQLAARLGLEHTIVTSDPDNRKFDFQWDAAILQDGAQAGWPFLMLGATAGLHGRPLLTGFSGDWLSGWLRVVRPGRAASLESLARDEYAFRGPVVSPAVAAACLRRELVVPFEAVMTSWIESFRRAEAGDLMTTYFAQRLTHRNRRRIAAVFHSMRSLCTVLHPFADRAVMEAYLTLPQRGLIGQRAHIRAAMAGPRALGDCPNDHLWWPLRFDPFVRPWYERTNRLRKRWLARPRPGEQSATQRRNLMIASESDLYDPGALAAHPDLHAEAWHLGASAMHVAAVTGAELPSVPPPLFLRPPAGRLRLSYTGS
jgi:asparagine synthetase B (glutamine-hydrolysing)